MDNIASVQAVQSKVRQNDEAVVDLSVSEYSGTTQRKI